MILRINGDTLTPVGEGEAFADWVTFCGSASIPALIIGEGGAFVTDNGVYVRADYLSEEDLST